MGAGTGRSPCGHAEGKRGLCLAVEPFGSSLLCALQAFHPAPTKPYRLWLGVGVDQRGSMNRLFLAFLEAFCLDVAPTKHVLRAVLGVFGDLLTSCSRPAREGVRSLFQGCLDLIYLAIWSHVHGYSCAVCP